MSDEVPLHQESIGSCALDGLRIQAFVTMHVIGADPEIPDLAKPHLIDAIQLALRTLDSARVLLPVSTTSIHAVGGGGIIVP